MPLIMAVAVLFSTNAVALGGRPAHPNSNNPRTESIFIHTLKPGESVKDGATLSNPDDTPQTIDVYGVDAMATNMGSLSCKQHAEKQEEVGTWMNVAKTSVTLPPHGDREVAFTISVPQSVEPGEHNGCLVFQPRQQKTTTSGNVRIRTRQAIRVAITVPGKLHKDLAIASFGAASGGQTYVLETKNKGNVSADAEVGVTLETLWGAPVFKDGGEYPMLPGRTLTLRFENEKPPMWGGWYKAKAAVAFDPTLPSGLDQKSNNRTELKSQEITVFLFPSVLALIIMVVGLLLLVGVCVFLVGRRKKLTTQNRK